MPTFAVSDKRPAGRPPKYSDADLIAAVRDGATTPDALITALGVKSKSALIVRLRRLRDRGDILLVERTRREGFVIGLPE